MTTNLLSVIEQLTKAAIYFKEVDPSVRSHCTWNGTTESEAAAAIEAGQQALEQTQGEWKHCSPELLASGVSCKDAPRRPCECEHGGSHDHWITHPQATEPAPIGFNGLTQAETEATMSVRGLSEPAPSTAVERTDTDIFKNFHRSLCARFGYTHDEKDWRRDLVSLEEHIAALISAPALPAAAMQLADDFAAAAVNHYGAGENDKALWQKMVDARQALETKLMGVK